jgi:rare lipoprotein A
MRALPPVLALGACLLTGCAGSAPHDPPPDPPRIHAVEVGVASYVGKPYEGRPTASGPVFDGHSMIAAHRTLPFGTRVRVTNLANDREVVVTIVDRGPFRKGRVIDVSRRAARELGFERAGTTHVRLQVLADRDAENP